MSRFICIIKMLSGLDSFCCNKKENYVIIVLKNVIATDSEGSVVSKLT